MAEKWRLVHGVSVMNRLDSEEGPDGIDTCADNLRGIVGIAYGGHYY